MHRALLINDIVKAIVAALPSHDERLKDLASLARSCRGLSEPALDRLWESVSIWNVAQTMTERYWQIEKTVIAARDGNDADVDAEDASESCEDREEVWTMVRTRRHWYRMGY
jgi:hypothetical protein